ncbi:MAG TPA: metalloregulator ArsR/SmtB family transcription factor [Gaiellaceae bacterium]|jgi:DNA-binding transcriptional ArsR family regulator|nr:metalloregulator ArsR/SmtB family transcription factor [Gaiellaceae bacterium]
MSAFEALADPTRRRIVELVSEGERSAGEIASAFAISRPGVSKHLRVLREHGVIRSRSDGTRRLYSLEGEGLVELDDWIRRFWTNRLDALETELRRGRRDRGKAEI